MRSIRQRTSIDTPKAIGSYKSRRSTYFEHTKRRNDALACCIALFFARECARSTHCMGASFSYFEARENLKKDKIKSVRSARVRTFFRCVRISVIQAAPRGGSNAVAAQKFWKRDLASLARTRPVRPGSRTALPHRPPDRVVPGPQRGRRLSLR